MEIGLTRPGIKPEFSVSNLSVSATLVKKSLEKCHGRIKLTNNLQYNILRSRKNLKQISGLQKAQETIYCI